MQALQEGLYVTLYIGPAIRCGESEGFVEPLSFLVICDSFLHSGSMLTFLRNRFAEKTPKCGGRERVWIASYIELREKWALNLIWMRLSLQYAVALLLGVAAVFAAVYLLGAAAFAGALLFYTFCR